MTTDPFAPDCPACAALCCLALAFDKGDLFAETKPAGLPCAHLAADATCSIHDRLSDSGWQGCVNYNCLGAGQATVQEIFGGRSWQTEPELAQPMMDAFRQLRGIRDLAAQLAVARDLPVGPDLQSRCTALYDRLMPAEGWTAKSLAAFNLGFFYAEFHMLTQDLRKALPERSAAASPRTSE